MTRHLIHIILTAVLIALSVWGCTADSDSAQKRSNRLIPAVEAVKTQYGSLPLTERLSGVVKARNQVEIYSEVSAVVSQVHAESGEEVTAGQALVSLRNIEYQERLKQAQASLQIAKAQVRQSEARLREVEADLGRTRALAEKGLTNDAELETVQTRALSAVADVELAQARVEQATATVAEQEENLAQTVIRAPVTGTVGDRNAEVGMMVGSGTRLFTLGQLDSVRVEIILTDLMLSYIKAGQRAEIQSDYAALGTIEAPLTRISPFLHPVTHSTEAQIDLPNLGRNLRSGMFVTVDVYYGESEKATIIPLSALYENPLTGETGVYVCRDSLKRIPEEPLEARSTGALTAPLDFEFVPVTIIAKGRMSAGVQGVDPGVWVVTIGQDLFSGEATGQAKVRPVEWQHVEDLQNLQREDLVEDVVSRKQTIRKEPSESGS